MPAPNFPAVWNKVFALPEADPADVVASLTEDAINAYLKAHFATDRDKYKYVTTQQFQTATGAVRTFEVSVDARQEITVTLPPLSAAESAASVGSYWSAVEAPDQGPSLHAPRAPGDPNIRVKIPRVALSISWDKLDGTGKWTWTPSEIAAEGECYVSLQTRKLVAGDGTANDNETPHYLRLVPTSISFSKTNRYQLSAQFQAFVDHLPPADKQLVMNEAVDKFDDLLVIAMNVVAAKMGPQMVQNIEIPSPVFLKHKVIPSALLLGDKQVSIAFSLDRAALLAENAATLEVELSRLELAIRDDLAEYGGFAGLAVKSAQPLQGRVEDIQMYTTDEIVKRMRRTSAVVAALQQQNESRWRSLTTASSAAASRSPVAGAMAIGITESILNGLARDALPAPQQQCSDWLSLGLVRGRVCYWARVFDPHVTVNNVTVSGNVGVDAGGAIEACIRKFWNCSWSWDCGNLSLGVDGRPGISLELRPQNGIAFVGQITGGFHVTTNLPFPFNKVIEAVSGAIVSFFLWVVNLFLRNLMIVIVLPAITVPNQKTKLYLSGFTPFSYLRPGSSDGHHKFIAYSVDMDAGA